MATGDSELLELTPTHRAENSRAEECPLAPVNLN